MVPGGGSAVKRGKSWRLLLVLLCGCGPSAAQVAPAEDTWGLVRSRDVGETIEREFVTMRDGIRLDTNIYLPATGKAPFPTILHRTPYLVDRDLETMARRGLLARLLQSGYAVVVQSERGRYWSEGAYSFLANARSDGYDTIDWISKQPWSSGKVGTIGCSSSAENQLGASVAGHEAHAAAFAQSPGAGIGRVGPYAEQGNFFRGGAIQLLWASWYNEWAHYGGASAQNRPTFPSELNRDTRLRLSKRFNLETVYGTGQPRPGFDYESYLLHLPVAALNDAVDGPPTQWEEFSRRTPGDAAWRDTEFINEGDRLNTPMLWLFSWYDVGVAPNVAMYNHVRERGSGPRAAGNQFMIIGPLQHCRFGRETAETIIGEREIGDARFAYYDLMIQWFDYWLKGASNDVLQQPRVHYYDMGARKWLSSDQFPPADSRYVSLYLDSQGNANSRNGDGVLRFDPPSHAAHDSFSYDPRYPVPTLGGGACCQGPNLKPGAFDQSALELRNDVLVYTSEPLSSPLRVAGFAKVDLFVSSDARDTDFTVKLVDVYPDGRAYNLDDSIFRVRYREGYEKAVPMEAGAVYKISIPPLVTANEFKQGHRIRLEVSSSNFPRYDRNLNTGGNNFDESKPVVATNSVHHSPTHVSRLELQVTVPE